MTFDAGETSKSFSFSATQDTVDDDDESVQLGFGSMPDTRVSAARRGRRACSDQFSQGSYTVVEGATLSVTVTLNADPERTVVVPMTPTTPGCRPA